MTRLEKISVLIDAATGKIMITENISNEDTENGLFDVAFDHLPTPKYMETSTMFMLNEWRYAWHYIGERMAEMYQRQQQAEKGETQ